MQETEEEALVSGVHAGKGAERPSQLPVDVRVLSL